MSTPRRVKYRVSRSYSQRMYNDDTQGTYRKLGEDSRSENDLRQEKFDNRSRPLTYAFGSHSFKEARNRDWENQGQSLILLKKARSRFSLNLPHNFVIDKDVNAGIKCSDIIRTQAVEDNSVGTADPYSDSDTIRQNNTHNIQSNADVLKPQENTLTQESVLRRSSKSSSSSSSSDYMKCLTQEEPKKTQEDPLEIFNYQPVSQPKAKTLFRNSSNSSVSPGTSSRLNQSFDSFDFREPKLIYSSFDCDTDLVFHKIPSEQSSVEEKSDESNVFSSRPLASLKTTVPALSPRTQKEYYVAPPSQESHEDGASVASEIKFQELLDDFDANIDNGVQCLPPEIEEEEIDDVIHRETAQEQCANEFYAKDDVEDDQDSSNLNDKRLSLVSSDSIPPPLPATQPPLNWDSKSICSIVDEIPYPVKTDSEPSCSGSVSDSSSVCQCDIDFEITKVREEVEVELKMSTDNDCSTSSQKFPETEIAYYGPVYAKDNTLILPSDLLQRKNSIGSTGSGDLSTDDVASGSNNSENSSEESEGTNRQNMLSSSSSTSLDVRPSVITMETTSTLNTIPGAINYDGDLANDRYESFDGNSVELDSPRCLDDISTTDVNMEWNMNSKNEGDFRNEVHLQFQTPVAKLSEEGIHTKVVPDSQRKVTIATMPPTKSELNCIPTYGTPSLTFPRHDTPKLSTFKPDLTREKFQQTPMPDMGLSPTEISQTTFMTDMENGKKLTGVLPNKISPTTETCIMSTLPQKELSMSIPEVQTPGETPSPTSRADDRKLHEGQRRPILCRQGEDISSSDVLKKSRKSSSSSSSIHSGNQIHQGSLENGDQCINNVPTDQNDHNILQHCVDDHNDRPEPQNMTDHRRGSKDDKTIHKQELNGQNLNLKCSGKGGNECNEDNVPFSVPIASSSPKFSRSANISCVTADVHHALQTIDNAITQSTSDEIAETGNRHHGHFVVVAIDFGTTYSGYAFSFTSDPDSIHMMRKWEGGDPGVINQKTPTTVLLSPSGDFHSFGFSARDNYHDMSKEEAQQWLYFDKFKMILHNTPELSRDTMLRACNGKLFPAITVFSFALQFFKDHALQELSDQSGTKIINDDIRWVISVPAIWKASAKQFMRQAAYEGGLISPEFPDQLVIALEPEAASIYCRKLRVHQLIPDVVVERPLQVPKRSSPEPMNMSPACEEIMNGTRYMVVDCGGGTVDITVHEVNAGGKLRELYKASGGPFGAIGVDKEFEMLLCVIFGKDFIETYKQKRPSGWVDLMIAFESRKRSAGPDKNTSLNVSLPFSFIDYYKKHKSGHIDLAIKRHADKGVQWSSQGMLRLSSDAMRRLFSPTIDRIKQAVGDVLNDQNTRGLKYLFLVGGFAESRILQHELRKEFSPFLKVIIPQGMGLTILKGSVLFGLDPTVVNVRKSRQTFGVGVLNKFNSERHPDSKKVIKDGKEWCTDVFDKYVVVDQPVAVGDVVLRSYMPVTTEQTLSQINIYCCENANAAFITDNGVKKCGTLDLELPEDYHSNSTKREIQTRMQFGETEIKVSALDIASGVQVQSKIDFLNR